MPDLPSAREVTNDVLVRDFVETFEKKDASLLGAYLSEDVVFESYGDPVVRGRAAVVDVWEKVFRTFEVVRFETVEQAVSGDLVIAEQVHGLGLAGRAVAPIRNVAVYEIRGGLIAGWRDYTNPVKARELLAG